MFLVILSSVLFLKDRTNNKSSLSYVDSASPNEASLDLLLHVSDYDQNNFFLFANKANQATFKRSKERGNSLEHKKAASIMRRLFI